MRYDDEHSRQVEALTARGLDPYSHDDSVLGTAYVYCASHLRAHTSGWCTVSLVDKYPLDATTEPDATAEARAKGFRMHGDPLHCKTCGAEVKTAGPGLYQSVADGDTYCPQQPGKNKVRHDMDHSIRVSAPTS